MAQRSINHKHQMKTAASPGRLKNARVAVVVADFNPDITEKLMQGASEGLTMQGISGKSIDVYRVAGVFEIPYVLQKCARSKRYMGAIALGCVIRGDTPHFEYVSLGVTIGCTLVPILQDFPVAFGVLTVNTLAQARARVKPGKTNKGNEAACALLQTLKNSQSF